jgi:hypothetical protein
VSLQDYIAVAASRQLHCELQTSFLYILGRSAGQPAHFAGMRGQYRGCLPATQDGELSRDIIQTVRIDNQGRLDLADQFHNNLFRLRIGSNTGANRHTLFCAIAAEIIAKEF